MSPADKWMLDQCKGHHHYTIYPVRFSSWLRCACGLTKAWQS